MSFPPSLSLSSSFLCCVYHFGTTGTFPWTPTFPVHKFTLPLIDFHLVSRHDSIHVCARVRCPSIFLLAAASVVVTRRPLLCADSFRGCRWSPSLGFSFLSCVCLVCLLWCCCPLEGSCFQSMGTRHVLVASFSRLSRGFSVANVCSYWLSVQTHDCGGTSLLVYFIVRASGSMIEEMLCIRLPLGRFLRALCDSL